MPLNNKLHLHSDIFHKGKMEQKPTRDGYGLGVVELGSKNQNIVVLCADLSESTRSSWFQEKYPDRYIELGVAEQNLAAVASGMSAMGKIPFIASYAMFSPGRNWEQIRTTIAYNEQNVKICGMHAGVSVGPDGATHQAIEDMAIMRVIPTMTVINACDANEAKKAVVAAGQMYGPVYLRFAREKTTVVTTEKTPFKVGRAEIFWESSKQKLDVTIIACGPLVYNALVAASHLEHAGYGVEVINNATIKPLDYNTILQSVKRSGAVVTVEEHQLSGGMGSAIAEFLAQAHPVPIEFIGVRDRFGESGEPEELIEYFGMGVKHIVGVAEKVLKRKRQNN